MPASAVIDPVQLPQERQPRRWLTFEQHEHDREVGLLHPPVERLVVLHRLPRADALLADQQDEGCCLGDFLGKLRQPEAAGAQALGREKERASASLRRSAASNACISAKSCEL